MKTDKVNMELTLMLLFLSGTALGDRTDWHFTASRDMLTGMIIYGYTSSTSYIELFHDGDRSVSRNDTIIISVGGTEMVQRIRITTKSYLTLCEVEVFAICKDGFTPKSGHIPRKCELDGQLSGHEPICTRKACVAVNHLEVNISGYSVHVSGPFLYEETKIVEYNHSLFYHVNGSLSVSCAVNGSLKWQHGKPPDLRKICILPKTIPNGIVNHSCLSDDKCEQGTTIRIECYEGFSTSNTYVKCLPSHSWNGDLFCEKLSTFETQTVAIASAASVGTLLIVASAIAFAVFLHRRKRKEHTKNKCTLHKPTNVLNVISETVNIGRAVETKDNTEYATSTAHFGLTRDEEAGMEKSYYSIGDRVKLPDNAIKVENLYDIIFSSESKETMKTQFK
ncbi:hypothetical protein MAR_038206, partial [Mya arenaria]